MKFLVLLFLFLSCGDSPFLNSDKGSDGTVVKSEFNSSVEFKKSREDLRDSSGDRLSTGKYNINGIWSLGPSISFENKLLIIVTNSEGQRVDIPLELDLYLWMPGMGHGSFPVSIEKISNGVYEVSEIFFTMDGYWDFHIAFLENDELIQEIKWPIDL